MIHSMRSILLVKTSAIGDVIQTFEALEYLRARFKTARIDWVVETASADLLKAHPLISNVIVLDSKSWRKHPFQQKTWEEIKGFCRILRQENYDLLFDLQANTKSALITQLAKAKEKVGFDRRSVAEKLNLLATTKKIFIPPHLDARARYLGLVQSFFDDNTSFSSCTTALQLNQEEEKKIKEILDTIGSKTPLMICFGSKWGNKQLLPSLWLSLLKRLKEKDASCHFFFVFGTEEEREVAQKMQLSFGESATAIGNLSLPLWQALMSHMQAVLTVDSAALHLCGTTKTPSWSVFGPSKASCYQPKGENHHAYQGTCPYEVSFLKRCPRLRTCQTASCLKALKEEDLFPSLYAFFLSSASKRSKSM